MKNIIKKYVNKEYLKNNPNKVALGVLILIFLASILIYYLITTNVSSIEREKIINETTPYVDYIEDVEDIDSDSLDKYIIFTLDYHYYEKGIDSLSSEKISDFINLVFDKEVTKEEIKNTGVSPSMFEKNIVYNVDSDSYIIVKDKLNTKELEEKEIVYYKLNSIRKKTKSKYKISYTKYRIKKPLDVLNYVLELNDDSEEPIDFLDLREYLQTGNIKKAKNFFNNSDFNLSKVSENEGTIKITYILDENNNFKIYEID